MHKIGVLTKAVNLVERVAKEHNITRVKGITLEVGELTGYLPVFFEKYFPIVIEDRPTLFGAELKIHVVRGQAVCGECQTLYNVMKCEGCCPNCKSRIKEILGGQEFLVKNIVY